MKNQTEKKVERNCENCEWFLENQEGVGFKEGYCMIDFPREKYRVKRYEFCPKFKPKKKK